MLTRNLILRQTYNDSIVLMQYTVELEAMPGVEKAAVMMATPATLQFLEENSLLAIEKKGLSSDDMILAATGNDEDVLDAALKNIALKLNQNSLQPSTDGNQPTKEKDLDESILWREVPEKVNLVLISVPGQYAAAEAWRALKSNRHVMLFSNNVSLEDEIELKKNALERGLLVMGPDCGTAIINRVPLGFANRIRQGTIGIVAAAGSGLQALTCLIDHYGGGISQAVGTGGRDLKNEVNGVTTRIALEMLGKDETTQVIVVLSKPPDEEIARLILSEAHKVSKPVVMCLLGVRWGSKEDGNIHFASTINEAAVEATQLARCKAGENRRVVTSPNSIKISPQTGCVRGFYSGGTLAYEAYLLLQQELGEIYSNIALDERYKIELDQLGAKKHIIMDLGTEEFTTGRPHPMIDGRWRSELITQTGYNKNVSVVLLDIILGFGANDNPAGAIVESIRLAQKIAQKDNRKLIFIASIIGTEQDPQGYSQQYDILQTANVKIAEHNEMAVQMAIRCLTE